MEKVLILGLGNNNGGKNSLLYFATKPEQYIVRVSDIAKASNFTYLDEFKDYNIEFFFQIQTQEKILNGQILLSRILQFHLNYHNYP